MTTLGGGRYEVLRELGVGGMGQVYVVRVRSTGARAALKTLAARLADDPRQLERFRREATAMGVVEHPHLVRSIDFDVEPDGTAFLVMELLDGRSLHQIVNAEGPLSGPRAARLGAQIASALHAAHAHGIVHRDLKPSNVVVVRGYDGGEMAKVIDFGIASIKESPTYHRLTATGQVVGTPSYMAPEQLHSGEVDARTDVYGLGALLYGLLAGRPPYPGGTMAEIVGPLLAGDRAPLRVVRPDIGPLAMVIERAMALAPNDRFASAAELETALARFASVPSVSPAAPSSGAAAGSASSDARPIPTAATAETVRRKPRAAASHTSPARASTGSPRARLALMAVAALLAGGLVTWLVVAEPESADEPPLQITPIAPVATPAGPKPHDAALPPDAPTVDAPPQDGGGAVARRASKRAPTSTGPLQQAPTAPTTDPPALRAVVVTRGGLGAIGVLLHAVDRHDEAFIRCLTTALRRAPMAGEFYDVDYWTMSGGAGSVDFRVTSNATRAGIDCLHSLLVDGAPEVAFFYRGRFRIQLVP